MRCNVTIESVALDDRGFLVGYRREDGRSGRALLRFDDAGHLPPGGDLIRSNARVVITLDGAEITHVQPAATGTRMTACGPWHTV